MTADKLIALVAAASYILAFLSYIPLGREYLGGWNPLGIPLFVGVLRLLHGARKARRRGTPPGRREWLAGLLWMALAATLTFNVGLVEGAYRGLLLAGFLIAGVWVFGILLDTLFTAAGRRHPKGHPVPESRRTKEVSIRRQRWRARGRIFLRRGGDAAGVVTVAGAMMVWVTRSAEGPFVPAEFGVGSPLRLGENIIDVMERRNVPPGEYGGISERIEGEYFGEIYYGARYQGEMIAAGPVVYVSYSQDRRRRPNIRYPAEKVIAICRRHYGPEGSTRTIHSIREGSIETERTFFWKEWKVDEMHSAVVSWYEEPDGSGLDLSFYIARWDEPVELRGDTVEVQYVQRKPIFLNGDSVGYSW